jgi:proline racemase
LNRGGRFRGKGGFSFGHYLRKLGAVIIRYYPNYYGQLSGTRHCGTPTDRFWARLEPGSERRKHNMPALVLHIDEYDSYEDVMANTSQKIAVEIPMVNFSHIISAIDTHTAGEPTRIVVSGVPHISGRTMADKKNYMRERLDYIRTLLTYEPRGHKDMFGVILVPPTTACAHYGVLFVDPTGYLDMCGSGIMAVTTVLLETGMVPMIEPETVIVLDTPAGLIESRAQVTGTQALSVSVANVPSFLWAKDVGLSLPDGRDISIDVAFGGNFFALVSAKALGVELRPENAAQLSEYETLIRNAVNDKIKVKHPEHGHIATVEITDFYDIDAPGHFVKSVAARGHMIDRSPCGTGTSSILATLYGTGKLKIGTEYTSESIIGTRFQGTLIKEVKMADVAAVAPVITGQAYITGLQQFVVDPSDPIKYGFVLS